MIKVAVSGYFNPLHKGHLEYLERAKRLGDYLIVILNSDHQVKLKGSVPFMNENERKIILESVVYVDEVFLSIDKDRSVCKSLRAIKPHIFANGGDRLNSEVPEGPICSELGIEIVDGLGEKIQSSSTLIKNAKYLEIGNRPWGNYFVLEEGENYKIKRIFVEPNQKLSLQSHNRREEHWVVVKGNPTIVKGEETLNLKVGDSICIPKLTKHRIENNTEKVVEIIEVQLGDYLEEDDIIRYEDIYDRA